MKIFNERLKSLKKDANDEQDAELDKATEDTYNNPEMTYYSYQPPPRRQRTFPPVQGLDGLEYWYSKDPSPATDG